MSCYTSCRQEDKIDQIEIRNNDVRSKVVCIYSDLSFSDGPISIEIRSVFSPSVCGHPGLWILIQAKICCSLNSEA